MSNQSAHPLFYVPMFSVDLSEFPDRTDPVGLFMFWQKKKELAIKLNVNKEPEINKKYANVLQFSRRS